MRHAHALRYHIRQFIADYPKLFKGEKGEKTVWIGSSDVGKEIDALLLDLEPLYRDVAPKIQAKPPN